MYPAIIITIPANAPMIPPAILAPIVHFEDRIFEKYLMMQVPSAAMIVTKVK